MDKPKRILRGLLIDPQARTVRDYAVTDSLAGFKEAMRVADPCFRGLIELIRLVGPICLWIDEEGNLEDGRIVWRLNGQPFTGGALLLACDDEGNDISLPAQITCGVLAAMIEWTDFVSTGCFTPTTQGEVDHPVFGKIMQISHGEPIFRPRDTQAEADQSTKN